MTVTTENAQLIKLGNVKNPDSIKYDSKNTIAEAKKILKKLVKISGLDVGELTLFNENCTIKYVYKYNGELFEKETYF